MDVFHLEKSEAFKAAIEVRSYLQIDDTGSRVNGQNHYTQILCNDLFIDFLVVGQTCDYCLVTSYAIVRDIRG